MEPFSPDATLQTRMKKWIRFNQSQPLLPALATGLLCRRRAQPLVTARAEPVRVGTARAWRAGQQLHEPRA
eukprot:1764984-Pleurochrysis_carterae.AAC.1